MLFRSRLGLASQNCANPGLVETAHAQIADVEPLDHRLLQLVHAAVAVEGAAALVRPGAGDRGNAESRVHVRRAVALARETVTEPKEAALRLAYEGGEFLSVQDYKHVQRWTDQIAARPAVKRGRMVNRVMGDPADQLRERHDAADFETKTQDKLEAVAAA